jgi:hypothetical protein
MHTTCTPSHDLLPHPFFVTWCPRWSVDAGIRNRGDPDFGTKELWLLDKIQEVCADAGFANPLPEYKSQYKLAKDLGEWLGAMSCT